MSSLLEQFRNSSQLSGGNAVYVEGLYEAWLADPASVAPKWQAYFAELRGGARETAHGPVVAALEAASHQTLRASAAAPSDDAYAQKQAGVLRFLTAYRSRGHLAAHIDPLAMMGAQKAPDLELPFHNLSDADLDTEFSLATFAGGSKRLKLREFWDILKRTYTASVGAEFMHISVAEERRWVYERMERAAGNFGYDATRQRRILSKLTAAEGLERFLHTKYVGQKRFSLEGGDSLIPAMDALVAASCAAGVKEIVIGMAHRGRLNVLVNTLGKAPERLFAEFEGKHDEHHDPAHSGDVKYHMGYSADVRTPAGTVHLALGFNPSHLEIVDPVIVGSVRSRQARRLDEERSQVLPILIHGDAAFAGQGVVTELFQMSQARGFAVGGTVHIVVNNQVGFTTSRVDDARSTLYCTDVAKMVGAPIFHVNGDDPEAVVFFTELAYEFRRTFKKDVVIDLVCYRRHGHNEADEPAATQPLMYQNIRARKTTRELYAERLAKAGRIGADEAQRMAEDYRRALEAGEPVTELAGPDDGIPTIDWSHFLDGTLNQAVDTALPAERLAELSAKINVLPPDLTLHPRVAKIYDDRNKMARGELAMDWGYAENLAYASLVAEGHRLRLVGQDAGRGTFFHRHAVLHDQKTARTFTPLKSLAEETRHVAVIDSLLSEEAVMAFEYGYATADPHTLCIWEGQFGDFANGAQVVIDQFISSGEAKWGRYCGLALFLPHGYEGQGPEHSSARLERFLQLCALHNMQVCVPTTPAQMFHMLRRQMLRNVRKPLIVMTPKSMLRHRLSTSTLADLSGGGFQVVIPDRTAKDPAKVKRVVLCSGKVYYDLVEDADKRGVDNVAIVRVEQLYPFPRIEVAAELARYPGARNVIWCQEEPMNQGAWYNIQHHLQVCLADRQKLHYAGRVRSPAPACGHFATHVAEQAQLTEQALVAKLSGDPTAE